MRHKEFWMALALGAVAGGIAALLYAPQSGAATRRKLRRQMEGLGESLEEAGEYLKEQADRLNKEAQKLLDASKSQFDSAYDSAASMAKSANDLVGRLI